MGILDNTYLYGELNTYVEYLKPEFFSDDTLYITTKDDIKVDLSVNTSKLLTLKQLTNDTNAGIDTPIKRYQLFAYNSKNQLFDIPIGEPFSTGYGSGGQTNISSIVINGQQIKTYIDEDGVMVLEALPAEVLSPESMLDGNGGEEPY